MIEKSFDKIMEAADLKLRNVFKNAMPSEIGQTMNVVNTASGEIFVMALVAESHLELYNVYKPVIDTAVGDAVWNFLSATYLYEQKPDVKPILMSLQLRCTCRIYDEHSRIRDSSVLKKKCVISQKK